MPHSLHSQIGGITRVVKAISDARSLVRVGAIDAHYLLLREPSRMTRADMFSR